MSSKVHDPWKNILAANEEILWQGAPKSQVRLEWKSPLIPIFFLIFAGSFVFRTVDVNKGGVLAWAIELLFFFVGMYVLVGVHFWKAFVRSRQHYTLTNQRALIGTDIFGRKTLQSYPITKTTKIDFEDTGPTGSIYFAKREIRGENGTTVTKIGFEQIEGPRQVLAKMRQVQEAR